VASPSPPRPRRAYAVRRGGAPGLKPLQASDQCGALTSGDSGCSTRRWSATRSAPGPRRPAAPRFARGSSFSRAPSAAIMTRHGAMRPVTLGRRAPLLIVVAGMGLGACGSSDVAGAGEPEAFGTAGAGGAMADAGASGGGVGGAGGTGCPGDAAPCCGALGKSCTVAADCGSGFTCAIGVCAPARMCATSERGVRCDTGRTCLSFAGVQDGVCVDPDEAACLCEGEHAMSFTCAP
jgi:hypothetical protein